MKKKFGVMAAWLILSGCQTMETQADRGKFHAADTNGDGKLTLEEANKAELPRIFKSVDYNQDGRVSLQEARDIEPGFDQRKMAEYDRNKDGSVSYDEFYKVQVAKGGLKKRFDAADTNRDGFVTLKEADARVQFLQAQAAGTL
jgi:Ca2+-binding EF-hand superfamily protein